MARVIGPGEYSTLNERREFRTKPTNRTRNSPPWYDRAVVGLCAAAALYLAFDYIAKATFDTAAQKRLEQKDSTLTRTQEKDKRNITQLYYKQVLPRIERW